MLERELLNKERLAPMEDDDVQTLRVANLVVGSGSFGEGKRWVTVMYYQPNAQAFADYRLSGESGLVVQLTTGLQLDLALIWRHDSRAPADLENDDIELRTGFTYRVR
jgi:hypothetical protein